MRHPKEILNIGDSVRVKIQDIDLDRRRVGLSLKALATDPWDTAAERYKVGAAVSGRVESVQTFGVFIEVESGVTALLPASESGLAQGQPLTSVFKPGNTVEARVLRVDASDRKMALSLRDEDEIRDRAERGDRGAQGARRGGPGRQRRGPGRDTRSNQPRSWIDAGNSGKGNEGQAMGSLGELLLKALKTDDD